VGGVGRPGAKGLARAAPIGADTALAQLQLRAHEPLRSTQTSLQCAAQAARPTRQQTDSRPGRGLLVLAAGSSGSGKRKEGRLMRKCLALGLMAALLLMACAAPSTGSGSAAAPAKPAAAGAAAAKPAQQTAADAERAVA